MFVKILTICLYFASVLTVSGLLDNANVGVPATSVDIHLQTVMEEMLKLQREVATLTKEVATLKAKDENVAFLAYLTNDVTNPSVGQTLIFDKTEVNDGNAYDSGHGVFVAPVSGTYHFALLASIPNNHNHKLHIFMKKNGKKEMYLFFDYNNQYWLQRGASQVLHLTRGDRIWTEVGEVLNDVTIAGYSQSEGAYHAHFSGFLIHAD